MSTLFAKQTQRPSRLTFVHKLGVGLAIGALALGVGHRAWAQADVPSGDDPRNVAGVWQITNYTMSIQPIDGGDIPFTPAGLAAYEENVNGLQDGSVSDFAVTLCLPPGVVRAMGAPDPFEIVLAQETLAILLKGFHRLARLDAEHNADNIELFPAFMGDQIARWDGDTLVIDTLGVNPYTWLDASGLPHGYDLHTVERIRKIEGGQLENVITIEDIEFFSRPWRVRYVYEVHPYVSMATGGHPCDQRFGLGP